MSRVFSKKKVILISTVIALLFVAQKTISYTNNPPLARTGAPNESSCNTSGCHSGTAITSGTEFNNLKISSNMKNDEYITEIFRVDATTTPAYTGLYDTSGEFFVVKISHVDTKDVTDPILVDTYTNQYKTALENAIQAAYIDDLRGQSKIKINTKLLN